MAFDAEGVCGACRVHERKAATDWQARDEELRALLARYRRSDGRPDVLVPGSGGKDSVMAAALLRDRYGMHPLTVTWAPHEYTDVGRRNFYRWLEAGYDNLLVTPNPRVHRKLTRLAFLNLCHPFQPFILGQRSLAPKIAIQNDIRLVVFGEDDAEYEGEAGWQERAEWEPDRERYHIAGESYGALLTKHGLSKHDLGIYLPAAYHQQVRVYDPDAQPRQPALEVIALGRYIRWDPEEAYYFAVEHSGFERNEERTPGTFTAFSSIDDKLDPLHYYTMFIKFGVGRASHDASMEIRNGRMTREEGVVLVKKYDGTEMVSAEYAAWCCDYMGITGPVFWDTIKRFKKSYPVVS